MQSGGHLGEPLFLQKLYIYDRGDLPFYLVGKYKPATK